MQVLEGQGRVWFVGFVRFVRARHGVPYRCAMAILAMPRHGLEARGWSFYIYSKRINPAPATLITTPAPPRRPS